MIQKPTTLPQDARSTGGPPLQPTRYAVRHRTGRYLALAYLEDRIVHVWTVDRNLRWSWPSMTEAIIGALSADTFEPELPWTVESVIEPIPMGG